ncbi:hypothetical protein [Cellvibrio sp. pealriver]|uniref:hypothetical protein n=1 Tax=Cellvibrio sp. pealriver TaxID=1622269 RepID=UPI00066FC7FE|nr:hypothetical protein [Cellvibrio sp. pealriver]
MALATSTQVEAVAAELTGCADVIHERLMKAIKRKEIERADAQLIFQDEIILRQKANGLYIDAANCVVAELAESQKSMMDTIGTAKQRLKNIKNIAMFIDLTADLIVLAAAISAAKPPAILAALKEIKKDSDDISQSTKQQQ